MDSSANRHEGAVCTECDEVLRYDSGRPEEASEDWKGMLEGKQGFAKAGAEAWFCPKCRTIFRKDEFGNLERV